MGDKTHIGYEVLTIAPSAAIETDYKFIESEWMICIDRLNKNAIEYNRKTGEQRPYDYQKAVRELFG